MSMFKEFAMPPLVLTVIAAVVTGALVATESVTTPIIEQQAAAAGQVQFKILCLRTGCFSAPQVILPHLFCGGQSDDGMEVGVALVHKEPALAACPQEMRTAQLRYCRAALEVRKLRKIVRESECIGEPLFRVDDGRELHATAEQLSILHVAFVPDAFR